MQSKRFFLLVALCLLLNTLLMGGSRVSSRTSAVSASSYATFRVRPAVTLPEAGGGATSVSSPYRTNDVYSRDMSSSVREAGRPVVIREGVVDDHISPVTGLPGETGKHPGTTIPGPKERRKIIVFVNN